PPSGFCAFSQRLGVLAVRDPFRASTATAVTLPEGLELLADHLGDEAPEARLPAGDRRLGNGEGLGEQLLQGDAERAGQAVQVAEAQFRAAPEHVAEGSVPDADFPFEVADGPPAALDQDPERLAQSLEIIIFHRVHSAAARGRASPSFTAFCKDARSGDPAAACK